MGERISVIKNYLYSLSYQILLLIVPFITMPYLARTLGLGNQGTFSVIQSVISVFVMVGCIGLNVYGQREIAYHKDDRILREKIFWEIVFMRVIMLTLSLGIYFAFIWFNKNVIAVINVYNSAYFAFFAIEIVASMLDISWYYQGIENFKLQAIRNFAVKLISLALIIIFVRDSNDLSRYIVLYTGMNVIGNGSLWFHKLKHEAFVKPDFSRFSRHFKCSFIMFLPQIATTVYAQLDRVMIGGLVNDGNVQVGVYDNAEKIVKIALTVVTSIGFVMLSRIANTYMKKDKENTKRYINASFKLYLCLATPIMFGIASIANIFVSRFFIDTEGSELIAPVIITLCPIIMFIGGSNVFGTQYLLPTNRMLAYTASVCTGMVINVIMNFILIPTYGALGAAFSTVIAELGVLAVQLFAVRREFGIKMYLFGWRYYLAGVVMFICVYNLDKIMSDTLSALFALVIIGSAVYFSIVLLLRDEFFIKYFNLFLNKIFKKH